MSPVLAAPASVRKSLVKQIQSGVPKALPHEKPFQPQAVPLIQPIMPTSDPLIQELRDEFQAKIQSVRQHFDSAISAVKDQVVEARSLASDAASSSQREFQAIAQRQEAVETKLEQVAQSVCSNRISQTCWQKQCANKLRNSGSSCPKGLPIPLLGRVR